MDPIANEKTCGLKEKRQANAQNMKNKKEKRTRTATQPLKGFGVTMEKKR